MQAIALVGVLLNVYLAYMVSSFGAQYVPVNLVQVPTSAGASLEAGTFGEPVLIPMQMETLVVFTILAEHGCLLVFLLIQKVVSDVPEWIRQGMEDMSLDAVSLCVCIYVCLYVHVFVCIYIYMLSYVFVCIDICMFNCLLYLPLFVSTLPIYF